MKNVDFYFSNNWFFINCQKLSLPFFILIMCFALPVFGQIGQVPGSEAVRDAIEQDVDNQRIKRENEISSEKEWARNKELRYLESGHYELKRENYDKAIDEYTKAIEYCTSKDIIATAYYCRGDAKFNKREYVEAIKDYELCIDKSPQTYEYRDLISDAYYSIGACNNRLIHFNEAVVNYNKASEIQPSINLFDAIAWAKVYLKEFESAKDDFTELMTKQKHSENRILYEGRALANVGIRDFDSALEDYNTSLSIKKNPYSFIGRAMILLLQTHANKDSADLDINGVLSMQLPIKEQVRAYSLPARILSLLEFKVQNKQALVVAKKLLMLSMDKQDNFQDYYFLAGIQYELGDYKSALSSINTGFVKFNQAKANTIYLEGLKAKIDNTLATKK